MELAGLDGLVRAKRPERMPVGCPDNTGNRKIDGAPDRCSLAHAGLLYGTGMRLMECLRLRV